MRVTTAVAAAALGALGCAAGAPAWQKDVEALRAEMRTMQRENAEMARRLEALAVRLDAVAAVRAHTAAFIRRLSDEAWRRAGTHSESGHYRAENWLDIYSAHLEDHALQIEANVSSFRARSA